MSVDEVVRVRDYEGESWVRYTDFCEAIAMLLAERSKKNESPPCPACGYPGVRCQKPD